MSSKRVPVPVVYFSLPHQYISGRFSNGYRATIGADFITKTLPHPSNPDESITLQIWVIISNCWLMNQVTNALYVV